MAYWTCENCGIGFKRDKSGKKPIRFCSQACYRVWRKDYGDNSGQFQKGNRPWNKNKKGIHLSPQSEFKPGTIPINKAPIGTTKIRTRKRDGKQRAWVKIAEPNIWKLRAKVVWEKAYGPLPKGLVIHHEDRNTLNDSLTNLVAMSRAAHLMEHRHEFEEKRKRLAIQSRRNSK